MRRVVEVGRKVGVKRVVAVGAKGCETPGGGMKGRWLKAKAEGEKNVRSGQLKWVVVRAGQSTDEQGSAMKIALEKEDDGDRGMLSRLDLAQLLAQLIAKDWREIKTAGEEGGDPEFKNAIVCARNM